MSTAPPLLGGSDNDHPSDHLAIVAKVTRTVDRPPSPHEARIDPTVLHDPEVIEDIETVYTATYAQHPPATAGHETPWELFKVRAHAVLMSATGAKRRSNNQKGKIAFLNSLVKNLYTTTDATGPYPAFVTARAKLENEIKEAKKKAAPRSGWRANISTLKEEVSSKVFYRAFKARHNNKDIVSLYDVPDWAHPEERVPLPHASR